VCYSTQKKSQIPILQGTKMQGNQSKAASSSCIFLPEECPFCLMATRQSLLGSQTGKASALAQLHCHTHNGMWLIIAVWCAKASRGGTSICRESNEQDQHHRDLRCTTLCFCECPIPRRPSPWLSAQRQRGSARRKHRLQQHHCIKAPGIWTGSESFVHSQVKRGSFYCLPNRDKISYSACQIEPSVSYWFHF
jgi:hypothetical protein